MGRESRSVPTLFVFRRTGTEVCGTSGTGTTFRRTVSHGCLAGQSGPGQKYARLSCPVPCPFLVRKGFLTKEWRWIYSNGKLIFKFFRYKPTIDQHKLVSKSVFQTIITDNYVVRIYLLDIWRIKSWFLYEFKIMVLWELICDILFILNNLIKALKLIFAKSFPKILILIFFHSNYRVIHLVWFNVNCSWNIDIGDLFSCWRTGHDRKKSENASDCFTNLIHYFSNLLLTLTRPLRRKLRMRWFFELSKVKESSFFKSDLTDLPQIFDAQYKKVTYFCRVSDESALIRNFLRNGRVRG